MLVIYSEGFFRYKHVNSYWTHHADSHNVLYHSLQRTEHMSFKIKETDKRLHWLTWNLLPSIHSVCVWLKRPKDPSQCVSSWKPLPFIHHAQLGLTGKPTSWAWRSEVKQGEISRCRLLCSNTSAFQIHTHTVAHKQEVVWERCMWAQWQRLLVCIGGKFTCLCVCSYRGVWEAACGFWRDVGL